MTDHDPDVGDHEDVDVELSTRRKLEALARVARFQPLVAGSVVALAVFAAVLEGVGVAFVEPIVAVAQDGGGGGGGGGGSGGGQSRLLGWLLAGYGLVGLPVTLGTLVLGVSVVMVVRYTASFLVGWLRAAIETRYVRHLQEELFRHALAARVSHFDRTGSDEVLNAIVTQSEYAGQVVRYAIKAMERALLALMYFAIAVYLAPVLAIVAAAFLGATTFVFRSVLDPGYSLGDEVASAKQGLQSTAQAGTQGIRDVKLFGLSEELLARFRASLDDFERYRIGLLRNDSAISSFYQLTTALAVFALVYLALTVSAMGVAQLGVFLFAMFRLGPKLSGVNSYYYRVEGELPHLVRTQAFVDELRRAREPDGGPVDDRDDSERGEGPAVKARSSWRRGEGATAGAGGSSERGESATVRAHGSSEGGEGIAVAEYGGSASDDGERVAVPSSIDRVAFRDVHFSYAEEEEPVLRGVSVAIERGEFVGIVGPSGAGKSTIASLLARLHEPDRGEITADGTPIDEYDPAAWRSQVAVVRQDPYVFDDTLYRNLTVADRDASRAAVERAAAIARVDEFAEALPEGYETVLGDQGVRLSGGQRQRVAIARALLADADVLVLDEATSELDASTERRVHEALRTDQDDAALIAIAHQFSTVTDADVIHVLDGGRIRESGPHGELLSNDGTYARLYELQAVGE